MQTQEREQGNNQKVRLAKKIKDFPVRPKPFRHKTLEERASEFDGKLILDGEYDWGESIKDSLGESGYGKSL